MPRLPSVFTAERLYSDPDTIGGYRDAVMREGGYRSALFALKASSIATGAMVDRLKAVAATQKISADEDAKVNEVVERHRLAEQDRRVERGYLFLEEVPAVQERIQAARGKRLAAVFGDELLEQMTKEEQTAAGTERLKIYELGSMTDRLLALNVRLPDDPDEKIAGVFRLTYARQVVVAAKREADGLTPVRRGLHGSTLFRMVPVNAAGIAYYGGTYEQWIETWALDSVTIRQLQAMNAARAGQASP
jgi:hypothetical protein